MCVAAKWAIYTWWSRSGKLTLMNLLCSGDGLRWPYCYPWFSALRISKQREQEWSGLNGYRRKLLALSIITHALPKALRRYQQCTEAELNLLRGSSLVSSLQNSEQRTVIHACDHRHPHPQIILCVRGQPVSEFGLPDWCHSMYL